MQWTITWGEVTRANVHKKYLPLGHLLLRRCDNSRPFILVRALVLLPIYTGTLLISPITYIPMLSSLRADIFSFVNAYHVFSSGIDHLYISICYFCFILLLLSNSTAIGKRTHHPLLDFCFSAHKVTAISDTR